MITKVCFVGTAAQSFLLDLARDLVAVEKPAEAEIVVVDGDWTEASSIASKAIANKIPVIWLGSKPAFMKGPIWVDPRHLSQGALETKIRRNVKVG